MKENKIPGQRWARARDCRWRGKDYEEVVLKQGLDAVKEPCRYLGGVCFRACFLKPCIDAWTLDPQPDLYLPHLQPLSQPHWTPISQLCAFVPFPLSLVPFLFFLGCNHPLEPSWKCHIWPSSHPHTSQFLFPRRAGLSHLIASSVPPLFLIQPLSMSIIIDLFKILLPLWISLWDQRLLFNHLSSTSA